MGWGSGRGFLETFLEKKDKILVKVEGVEGGTLPYVIYLVLKTDICTRRCQPVGPSDAGGFAPGPRIRNEERFDVLPTGVR